MNKQVQNTSNIKSVTLQERSDRHSWFTALKHSWQSALQIDRSQITAVQAIRSTIGFVLPLVLGVATGQVVEGVSLAGGAAALGSVGLTFTYRARTRTLLLACIAIALSAFVGSITSRIDWLAILTVGLWGFTAGLLASISQRATIIGIQAVVALIILSHFALDPFHAALQALLMFAGALLQTLLAIIPLPGQRTAPERTALAQVYRKLAIYTIDAAEEQNGREVRNALLKAHTTLTDSNLQNQQGKIFFGLLEEAERIRLVVIALTRLRRNLPQEMVVQADSTTYLDQVLQASAEELGNIANELKLTRTSSNFIKPHRQLKQALTALRRQDIPHANLEVMQQIVTYCDTLRALLHIVKKLAKSWRYPRQSLPVAIAVPQQQHLGLRNAWTTLRANLTPRSAFFRHAIRMGVTLALATALYRITPLPIERGYWIPLTALLVLKPDFTTTFTRGVARLVGTIVGAVLTSVLVATLAPTKEVLVILDAVAAYLAFASLLANYAIFSAFITMEVILLLLFVEPQPFVTAEYRAIDTLIGGALALAIYAFWPTWEHPQVLNNIANRLEALRNYFTAVMQVYANLKEYDPVEMENLRMDIRLARSNAEASLQRSQQEPETRRIHRVDPDIAEGLLSATDSIAQRVLALEAYLVDDPAHHMLPEVTPFTNTVDEALHTLATSIRGRQPIATFPNLQEALRSLEHAKKVANSTGQTARIDLHFVLAEAKALVRSINAMKQLLATRAAVGSRGM